MTTYKDSRNFVSILMVEDDDLDVEVFKMALEKEKLVNPLVRANNGEEALEILHNTHSSKSIERPYLVLMDINMPRMNGLECLQEMRKDPKLKDSVVFIMTTSDDERDIYEAYNLNVAGYIVKSSLGESFLKAIQLLDKYFHAIVLPE